jgi:peroxiredoxin
LKKLLVLFSLCSALTATAWSQTAKVTTAPSYPTLSGRALSNVPVQLSDYKGKVIILYFWTTDCAVCLDAMNEIRMNTAGWSDKPFLTIAVNLNKNRIDFDNYIYTLTTLAQNRPQLMHMYGAEKDYRDTLGSKGKMPQAFVIDVNGKLTARFQGRIPANAWDDIADLLP